MLPSSRLPRGPGGTRPSTVATSSPSVPLAPDDRRSRALRPVYHFPPDPGTAVRVGATRYDAAMRLVIARCSVDYTGRLSAHLPSAIRLLLVKADGSVLVHSDGGAYKPLNWMSAPCTLVQEPGVWRVANRTGESMTIHIEEILHDSSHDLGVDPGLVKDGVERRRPALGAIRGVLAAQAFTQQARTLAAARGINCVTLDYDALRGMEPNTPTLF